MLYKDIYTWNNYEQSGTLRGLKPKHEIKVELGRHLAMKEKMKAQSMGALMNTWKSHI